VRFLLVAGRPIKLGVAVLEEPPPNAPVVDDEPPKGEVDLPLEEKRFLELVEGSSLRLNIFNFKY
jgi:hypothetical protein